MPGTCLATRIAMAAVAGYLLGALSGNPAISWGAALLGAGAVVAWRLLRRGSTPSCGPCAPTRRS